MIGRAVLIVIGALFAVTTHATQIAFNTFGPGDTYAGNQGYNVAGASSSIGYESTAAKFTSGASGMLLEVDLGITNFSGSGLFDVFLYNDTGTVPSNPSQVLIASTTTLASFGSNNSVVSVTPVTPISLALGTNYWLVVKPGSPTTQDAWDISLPNVPGTVENSVDDVNWFHNDLGLPAFRLIVSGESQGGGGGTVPESGRSVWLMLISLPGLLGVYTWRVRSAQGGDYLRSLFSF